MLNRTTAIAVVLVVATALTGIMSGPAAAQDATWLSPPGSNSFFDGRNWSTGTAPTGTATLGASNTTSLDLSIGGWSNSTVYNTGQEVRLNGVNYVAVGNSFNVTPGSDPTVWATVSPVWSSTTAYSTGQQAVQGGINYLALTGNFNVTPGSDGTVWTPFVGSGINGITLAPGASNYTLSLGGEGLVFTGAGIVVNGGSLSLVNDTGVLNFMQSSTAGSATITTNSGAHTFFTDHASGGTARLILNGTGIVDISQLVTGGTTVGSIEGAGTILLGGENLTVGANDLSTIFSGVLRDGGAGGGSGGSLTKVGSASLLTLTGANTYTGPTIVNAGALSVNGSIVSAVTVNGGILSGTGSVGNTVVNSGILLPGNTVPGASFTVAGSLAFASAATYVVFLNPSTSTFTNVTGPGPATLGGAAVSASFASGSYVSKQYTILTAAGGLSGTFGSLSTSNLPANFHTALSYDLHNVYLNLILDFGIPGGLNGNQQAVGNALTSVFNANGSIPGIFGALSAGGLSQAAGEPATGTQQATFSAMTQYMTLLTDFSTGQDGGADGATAPAYAEEGESAYAATRNGRDAFAMFTKAPPRVYEPRWSVWASGFGGSQTTDGNAAAGTSDTTSRIAGTAVGASYLFSPRTVAGFSLAGGGTSFSVNGLGSGRSDLFQAGAYVRHREGPAYVAAALAYGWQDITTNRTLTIAGVDQLRAEFNANAYSGRVEGGYRFVAPWAGGVGITPYAAGQFTTFDLPAYAESVVAGTAIFALSYAGKSVTDSRSELGIRSDKSFALANSVLTLRSRFAWAHDFDPDRSVAATFQALPGASFVVNGAALASDSALTTASVEMKWLNGWAASATFEGEFSSVTASYAGKGVLRYTW